MPQYLRGIGLKPPRGGSSIWSDPGAAGDVARDGFFGPAEGDVTIDCAAGTATASGLPAVLSAALQAGIGSATATGLQAGLEQGIACALGSATAVGLTAGLSVEIECAIGSATAEGLPAGLQADVQCNIGTALAEGLTCTIIDGQPIVIDCAAGTAAASGLPCTIQSGAAPSTSVATDPRLIARHHTVAGSWGFPKPKDDEPDDEPSVGPDPQKPVAPLIEWAADAEPAISSGLAPDEPDEPAEPTVQPAVVLPRARSRASPPPVPDQVVDALRGNALAIGARAGLVVTLSARHHDAVAAVIAKAEAGAAAERDRVRRQRAAYLAISLLMDD
jgi:hypothetical protein